MREEEKLEILLHNIRPCFSAIVAASVVATVDALKISCRNYERIKSRTDNFKEPPAASSATLAPEFAYCKRKEAANNSDKPKYGFYRSRYPPIKRVAIKSYVNLALAISGR